MTETASSDLVRIPPHAASPTDLPEALRALWQAACGEGGDVARALTMNFIAVASADNEIALRDAADRLMRRSPARAFLLSIDDSRSQPSAEVAAVTRCHGSTRDVQLEEIWVRLPQSWFPHVPGLVRPLLINDLPSHLFWAEDWRDDSDFAALRALSDHCIVDSKRFTLPVVQLARLSEERQRHGAITDLSWLRLRPWRRALAEAFEQVTWRPEFEVQGVIRHGRDGAAAAILLAQWLETKLDGRMTLEESQDVGDPSPESATLRFEGCEIEATSSDKCLTVHVSTPAQCFLPFRLPRSSAIDGDLLAAAIDIA